MPRSGGDIPQVDLRDDNLVSIDYGPPGPFLTLTTSQLSNLLAQAWAAGLLDPTDPGWAWNK